MKLRPDELTSVQSTDRRLRSITLSQAAGRGIEGMTLLEMLVVITILGMIAMIVSPPIFRHFDNAKIDTARLQMQSLVSSLDLYQQDMGRYPTQEEGLAALVTPPGASTRWNGPYVRRVGSFTDPWGKIFVYKIPGKHGKYDLYSEGAGISAWSGDAANAVHNW